jgi:hypothetical protein
MTSCEDQFRAESVRVAEAVAATRDQVARTMDTLAEQRPCQEEHLRALGDEAGSRQHASGSGQKTTANTVKRAAPVREC